jgi:hypothetical protein
MLCRRRVAPKLQKSSGRFTTSSKVPVPSGPLNSLTTKFLTTKFLTTKFRWAQIGAVAKALMDRHTLSAAEVRQIYFDALQQAVNDAPPWTPCERS